MYEDAMLDQVMEDRMSGGSDYYDDETRGLDPYDLDSHWEYDDEDEADEDPGEYVREDFGWFGDEALCGE